MRNVYEIRLKIYLLQDIMVNQIQEKAAALVDKGFMSSTDLMKFHEENKYKGYVFGMFYPLEQDKCYNHLILTVLLEHQMFFLDYIHL